MMRKKKKKKNDEEEEEEEEEGEGVQARALAAEQATRVKKRGRESDAYTVIMLSLLLSADMPEGTMPSSRGVG